MKAYLVAIALLIQSSWLIAQTNPKLTESYKVAEKQYHMGLKYNDMAVSKNALYSMLAIDPDDYSLRDSLAYIYFDFQQYTSAALITQDILKKYPNYLPALEMGAIAFENMGLIDKALENYESLYLKNNNVFTLYKAAYLQYQLKRYKESVTSLDIVANNKSATELQLSFPINDKNDTQEVSLKAAAINLSGLCFEAQGDKAKAKEAYTAALAIAPDFVIAKENLAALGK